jgi:folylpolyglutamate synthase/dihydropteroate synthase
MSEMHNLNAFRHSLNTLNYRTALEEFTALRRKSSLIGVISQKDIAAYLNLLTVVVTNPSLHNNHHSASLASLGLIARDFTEYVNSNVWSVSVETNAIYIVC